MLIRNAKPEDLTNIVNFQIALAKETENLVLDFPTVTAGVNAVLINPNKGQYYIAELDGEPIGGLLTTYEWSDWRNGTVLWIQSVYIQQDHRKQGVFRQLYKAIQDIVNTNDNLKGIRLYADQSNISAQNVYKHLGMSAEHYQLYEWLK